MKMIMIFLHVTHVYHVSTSQSHNTHHIDTHTIHIARVHTHTHTHIHNTHTHTHIIYINVVSNI